MKNVVATLCVLLFCTVSQSAVDQTDKSGAGIFVSFRDGTLTLKNKSGELAYKQVGENYKTFENNETGPGVKPVATVEALSRVVPGTVFQVDAEKREITFGLDYRVIGTFASCDNGKLELLPAEVPQGFIKRPASKVTLTIDRNTPVLQSVNGDIYTFAGLAGDVLKTVKVGTMVTARSEYNPEVIEVIQIGESKRRMERYVGQTRGTVRGSFLHVKDGVLRIRGKGITSMASNEYERTISVRITDKVPISESIDGGAYKPVGVDALKSVKEGEIITIRKVEEVVLEIQIGVAK